MGRTNHYHDVGQVLFSLVDLHYFGADRPPPGGTGEVWAELSAAYSSISHVAGTQPQARFSHLTIYGACYYAYLYARCLSEAVWRKHLAQDPLDRTAGAAYSYLPQLDWIPCADLLVLLGVHLS